VGVSAGLPAGFFFLLDDAAGSLAALALAGTSPAVRPRARLSITHKLCSRFIWLSVSVVQNRLTLFFCILEKCSRQPAGWQAHLRNYFKYFAGF
jgi:hypothetical protein